MQGVSTRREFVCTAGSCLGYLAATAAIAPPSWARSWSRSRGRVVAQESFGRIEEIGDGLWALISTPLTGDYTTLSNGGIIRGRDGVLVVEGLASPEGARWLADRARELAGRPPTHAVVTHYHGDHSRGLEGLTDAESGAAPAVHATTTTRRRVLGGFDADAEPERARPWADVTLLSEAAPGTIDLGGRVVRVTPHAGHTPSDVVVDLDEESVTWCGDLVWNRMFPNYVDATPSVLTDSVRAIRDSGRRTFVPGHGPLADAAELETYARVLDDIEVAARRAISAGESAAEAATSYALPSDVGEWTLFNPGYFERAIGAWMDELGGGGARRSKGARVSG